jgi:predicted transport protein
LAEVQSHSTSFIPASVMPMEIDADAVRQAKLRRMREEASGYDRQSLSLDEGTKALFDAMRTEIISIGADVVEIFRAKSVTYRVFDYFVEVIPRKQHLTLLFNIDFEECDDPSQLARDASNKVFIINPSEKGGVIPQLWSQEDFPAALHIVK